MKTIVFTGDSHTCGQGATGFTMLDEAVAYDPAGKGIGRNITFESPCYVNLVRNYLTAHTDTSARELLSNDMAREYGLPMTDKNVILTGPLEIQSPGERNLIKFGEREEAAVVELYVSGILQRRETLQASHRRYGRWSYRYIPVDCQKGDTLLIQPVKGEVCVSSIELYSGEYAVVNSGVGACPCIRYADDFFEDCVEAFSPDIVVAEAHSINDWLSGITPEQCVQNLSYLLNKIKKVSRRVLLLTVSPIGGNQALPFNIHEYSEYVEASRKAAQAAGIPCIDTNRIMATMLEGLTEEEKNNLLFHDCWHVNNLGHRIYAEQIIEALETHL